MKLAVQARIAGQAGEPAEPERLSAGDLRRAGEVLITSTARGIIPVTVIDGRRPAPACPARG